jgi:hypothetical protein
MEGVGFSPVTRSRRRRCLLLGGLSGANSARRWTLAIRESTACQVDKLQASFEFRYKTEGYRMHGERRVLTSGAEGDPSPSFSTLPISRSEIRASSARRGKLKHAPRRSASWDMLQLVHSEGNENRPDCFLCAPAVPRVGRLQIERTVVGADARADDGLFDR